MKVKYKIIETKATPFGGLYVLSEFLNQIKFHKTFDDVFGRYRKVRKYLPSDNIQIVLASIAVGGERVYDINRFEIDQVIPDLFGTRDVPADTTLRDDFSHIGEKDWERRELLLRLNETFFEKCDLKSITIDIDLTALPVDGHQECAEKGYCPTEPGSRCFQSLSAICDETETTLAEKTYPGNTKLDSKEVIEFLKIILDRLVLRMKEITIRLDAGFYSDELLLFLESYDNVVYIIKKPKHEWLKNKVTQIDYKTYYRSRREYASFEYGEGLSGQFRYYFVERAQKEPGTQINLFDSDDYVYAVVVSNRKLKPHLIFKNYNKRGRDEKHFQELKSQYALGKMVSKNFTVTKTLCWLSYLTFTIVGMLRRVAFRREMVKYRLRRLRFLLFTVVASFARHSRKKILNISMPRITPWRFDLIMRRIWAF